MVAVVSVQHRLRVRLRQLGVDVSRYPADSVDYAAMRAFLGQACDVVLDVGAHTGEFVRQCRSLGYHGPAVSFEPSVQTYGRLQARAASDRRWVTVQAAVGDRPGTADLHVAGNDGASSSLQAMLPRHERAAPESRYVGQETVAVIRLDEWLQSAPQWRSLSLKVDVQGYERNVLAGLGERFEDVQALRVELSMRPLYENSWAWLEASEWICERGLVLVGVIPGFQDPVSMRQLQFDAVFARP